MALLLALILTVLALLISVSIGFVVALRELRSDMRKLLSAFRKTHENGYPGPSALAVVTGRAAAPPALPSPEPAPKARFGALDAEVLDLARITLRVARSRTQGIHYPGGTVAVLSYTPEEHVRVEALAARWGCDVPDTIARLLQIALDLDEDPSPPTSSLN